MKQTVRVITMIFVLIGVFLILSRAKEMTSIVGKIGELSISGIKTLQARA